MPRDFPSLPDHVFRNDGGRFVDVTTQAGFVDPDGRGLGVVAADLDDDNKIDLYVANDMSANYLFRNLGGFRFEETGELAGAAASADGLYKSGMGIACGDLDGDGSLDLAVTNYFGESTTFYRNLGRGLFADHTAAIGLLAPSRPLLGFGIAFADVNNDGWLDLLSTNGHVLDSRPRIPWMMPLQLLLGGPGGRLDRRLGSRSASRFEQLHLGRGLAIGDLDNDGRLDALVLNQNEPLVYLHNTNGRSRATSSGSAWRGRNRIATAWGRASRSPAAAGAWSPERIGGGSYQSASDPRLHFRPGSVPARSNRSRCAGRRDGSITTGADADREYRLREGASRRTLTNGLD